ncbi:hypothetical protein UFOVP119_32 [uncultured Caudovirales phage]|uniref:Uncharacterized protein n=1 Tax=uncultured Caudovirales phage TaxID=2100421 RepID=A0A6J5L715_9CAUD|nr:hypothetical protein UFOVP119_32 [uncultured Caudovirales phage]
MSQSRTGSIVESAANIAVGFSINWLANMFILPAFGFPVTGGTAFEIGLVFTVISVVRSYTLRRIFNRLRIFIESHPVSRR